MSLFNCWHLRINKNVQVSFPWYQQWWDVCIQLQCQRRSNAWGFKRNGSHVWWSCLSCMKFLSNARKYCAFGIIPLHILCGIFHFGYMNFRIHGFDISRDVEVLSIICGLCKILIMWIPTFSVLSLFNVFFFPFWKMMSVSYKL